MATLERTGLNWFIRPVAGHYLKNIVIENCSFPLFPQFI